jgi:putative endonuclease
MGKIYCVYILASRSRVLYIGVTSQLLERVKQHREGLVPGFTSRYRIHRLVYFESFENPKSAITREKQIKGWNRAKKVALIEESNSAWEDLAEKYFAKYPRKADPSAAKGAASG